jgi:hypothetical protein
MIIVSATARCIPVRPEVSKGERASFVLRYLSTNGNGPAGTMINAVGHLCLLGNYPVMLSGAALLERHPV